MLRFDLNAPATSTIASIETGTAISRKPAPAFLSILGIGQIVSWGTLYYAYPLIAERISQEMLLSKSEAYGAATAGLLVSACLSYPVGRAIDNGHGRQILSGGSLLAGLLLMVWSRIWAGWMNFPIVMLLGIAQSMTLYEAAFALLARTSRQKEELSQSITKLTLWGAFASTIFVPLVEFLAQELGWRNALIMSGMFNLALAGLYSVVIQAQEDRELPAVVSCHSERFLNKEGKKHRRFKIYMALVIAFGLYSLVFSGLSFHIYPFFAARELSPMIVASFVALLGPAQVLGRLFVWRYAKQVRIARAARYVLPVFPVAVLALISLPPIWALLSFVVLYGIANGIMTIVRGIVIPDLLSRQSYGSRNSLISVPATACKAMGPFALAYSFQQFSSFDSTILAVFLLTLLIVASYWYAVLSS